MAWKYLLLRYYMLSSIVILPKLIPPGYLGFEFPAIRLLQRLPLAKYSGFCIIAWGVTLACFSTVQNFAGAVTIRLFLGIFEASVSPAWTLFTAQVNLLFFPASLPHPRKTRLLTVMIRLTVVHQKRTSCPRSFLDRLQRPCPNIRRFICLRNSTSQRKAPIHPRSLENNIPLHRSPHHPRRLHLPLGSTRFPTQRPLALKVGPHPRYRTRTHKPTRHRKQIL